MIILKLCFNLMLYIMRKIETKEELIEYLTRVCAAYRKSYKLYGRVNKGLQNVGGFVGSVAVIAVVPVIPVFIATISIVIDYIGGITEVMNPSEKSYVEIIS